MYEKEIKAIGLFFFLALLDERKAKISATKAVGIFLRRMKKNPQMSTSVTVVAVTKKIWDKSRAQHSRGRPQFTPDSGWLFPKDLDLSPWMEFQKSAPEDELLVSIWTQGLKISNQDLSLALGITEGTIRYRLARAFRKIGGMLPPTDNKPDKKIELVRS